MKYPAPHLEYAIVHQYGASLSCKTPRFSYALLLSKESLDTILLKKQDSFGSLFEQTE